MPKDISLHHDHLSVNKPCLLWHTVLATKCYKKREARGRERGRPHFLSALCHHFVSRSRGVHAFFQTVDLFEKDLRPPYTKRDKLKNDKARRQGERITKKREQLKLATSFMHNYRARKTSRTETLAGLFVPFLFEASEAALVTSQGVARNPPSACLPACSFRRGKMFPLTLALFLLLHTPVRILNKSHVGAFSKTSTKKKN